VDAHAKKLNDCTVPLLSSAGIVLKADRPFDQEGERLNPWWGDPSCRILPAGANEPPETPPFGRYLARNPWFLPKLFSRNAAL
jgi:hypothetical protein